MQLSQRFTILAALVAVILGGCGGGSDSAPSPRDVVRQYFAALADGDADKTCGLLAPAARTDVANYAKAIGEQSLRRCESAFGLADRRLTAAARSTLRRARVTSLEVDGDRATATVSGTTRPVPLVRRDGEWRVARLDFRYETFRVRAGQIMTRYASAVKSLPRPALTRGGVLGYLEGLRSALEGNRRELAALGRPPERARARDTLLAGFAAQQRIVTHAITRLRAGASARSVVADFQRRQRAPTRAINAAQATLQIRGGGADSSP